MDVTQQYLPMASNLTDEQIAACQALAERYNAAMNSLTLEQRAAVQMTVLGCQLAPQLPGNDFNTAMSLVCELHVLSGAEMGAIMSANTLPDPPAGATIN